MTKQSAEWSSQQCIHHRSDVPRNLTGPCLIIVDQRRSHAPPLRRAHPRCNTTL